MKQVNNTYAVLFLFVVTFILVVSIIIGCSDAPYTGSMLQPGDVDKYISRPEPGKICLQKNGEIICIDITTEKKRETIIHIHRRRIIYTFYYEAAVLIRTEEPDSVPDTKDDMAADQDINAGNGGTTADNNGGGNGGDNNNGNTEDPITDPEIVSPPETVDPPETVSPPVIVAPRETVPDNSGGNGEDNNNGNTEDPVTDPEIVSPPVQPQTVSCGGLSCHAKIINGKPILFETVIDGPNKGQQSQIDLSELESAGDGRSVYQVWLDFLSTQ